MATDILHGILKIKTSSLTFKAQSIVYGQPSIYVSLFELFKSSFTYLDSLGFNDSISEIYIFYCCSLYEFPFNFNAKSYLYLDYILGSYLNLCSPKLGIRTWKTLLSGKLLLPINRSIYPIC